MFPFSFCVPMDTAERIYGFPTVCIIFSRVYLLPFPSVTTTTTTQLVDRKCLFFSSFYRPALFRPSPNRQTAGPTRESLSSLNETEREIGRARAPGRKNFNSIPWLRYSCLSLFTFGKPVLSVCCWASVLYAPHRPVFLFFSGLFFLVTPPQQHLTDAVTLFAYGSRSTMSRGRQQKTRHQRRHLTRGGGGQ